MPLLYPNPFFRTSPFFERPLFSNAEQVLRDILTLDPGNAEAQHNLAILQRKQQLLVGV